MIKNQMQKLLTFMPHMWGFFISNDVIHRILSSASMMSSFCFVAYTMLVSRESNIEKKFMYCFIYIFYIRVQKTLREGFKIYENIFVVKVLINVRIIYTLYIISKQMLFLNTFRVTLVSKRIMDSANRLWAYRLAVRILPVPWMQFHFFFMKGNFCNFVHHLPLLSEGHTVFSSKLSATCTSFSVWNG